VRGNGLIETLFPKARHQILGALMTDAQREWTLSDLAKHYGTTPSTLQRELATLVEASIILRWNRDGKVVYQANSECPLFPELQGLFVKSFGLADRIREALAPLGSRIRIAMLHGGYTDNERPIDLVIVGSPSAAEVHAAIGPLEICLGRAVNTAILGVSEFAARADRGDYFVRSLLDQPHMTVIGDELIAQAA
jgi:hypothetical protein